MFKQLLLVVFVELTWATEQWLLSYFVEAQGFCFIKRNEVRNPENKHPWPAPASNPKH